MTYTPGPWLIEKDVYSGDNWLVGSLLLGYSNKTGDDVWIHITTDHLHGSQLAGSDAMDDARLIAAAPQLLEACKLLEADLSYLQMLWGKEGITDGNVDRLRAAIAAAESK